MKKSNGGSPEALIIEGGVEDIVFRKEGHENT